MNEVASFKKVSIADVPQECLLHVNVSIYFYALESIGINGNMDTKWIAIFETGPRNEVPPKEA